jgi:hypothetical protein
MIDGSKQGSPLDAQLVSVPREAATTQFRILPVPLLTPRLVSGRIMTSPCDPPGVAHSMHPCLGTCSTAAGVAPSQNGFFVAMRRETARGRLKRGFRVASWNCDSTDTPVAPETSLP